MNDEIKITYKLLESDYIKAFKLNALGTRKPWLIVGVPMLLWLVYLFVSAPSPEEGAGRILVAVVILAIYYALFYWVFSPFRAKQQYRNNRFAYQERTIEFSTKGFHYTSESIDNQILWSDLKRWSSNKDVYLIYFNTGIFHIIPSTVITDEVAFKAMLNKNLSDSKSK